MYFNKINNNTTVNSFKQISDDRLMVWASLIMFNPHQTKAAYKDEVPYNRTEL